MSRRVSEPGGDDSRQTDLKIERPVRLSPARAFEVITRPEHIARWWGPEGITLGEHQLDFSRPGPWSSVMTEPESGFHRVSGEVLAVSDGEAVEISWAWRPAGSSRRRCRRHHPDHAADRAGGCGIRAPSS